MLSASAIMSCTPAPALAATHDDVQAAKEQACESVAGLAESVMRARQSGAPLAGIMKHANGLKTESKDDELMKAKLKSFIVEAYEHPKFNSEQFKQNAIQDFADKKQLQCLKYNGVYMTSK